MAKSAGCFRIRDPTNHGNGCLIRSRNTMDSWETLEKHPLHADRMDSKWSVKTVCFWDLGSGLIKHCLTSDTSFWNTTSYQFLLSNLEWAAHPWNWFNLHGTNISHLKKNKENHLQKMRFGIYVIVPRREQVKFTSTNGRLPILREDSAWRIPRRGFRLDLHSIQRVAP